MRRELKRCAECGGTREKKVIIHTQARGQELYRFESVPALVCTQSGHVWVDASTSQLIDEIIRKHPKPTKYQRVPVFSLSELIKDKN